MVVTWQATEGTPKKSSSSIVQLTIPEKYGGSLDWICKVNDSDVIPKAPGFSRSDVFDVFANSLSLLLAKPARLAESEHQSVGPLTRQLRWLKLYVVCDLTRRSAFFFPSFSSIAAKEFLTSAMLRCYARGRFPHRGGNSGKMREYLYYLNTNMQQFFFF